MDMTNSTTDMPSPFKTCRYCHEPVATMRELIEKHTPCPAQGGRVSLPVLDELTDKMFDR
jgi:hypothetical protein